MKTKVEFLKKLPSEARLTEALGFKPEKFLIIYDRKLEKNPDVRKWLKEFPYTYGVHAGESLKDLHKLPDHVKKILKLLSPSTPHGLCLVGIGGGSVGDFTGFLASIVKRGVPLIHIPSTLLAAIDSAHGGKTALNVGEFKNQVGTFYFADSVLVVRSLFEGLPGIQVQSAAGELIKMALIEGGDFFESVKEFKPELDFIWENLPKTIEAKNRWVMKDPMEKSGERQILNLGHSLGHVLESYYGLPHGVSVGYGVLFSLLWSHHQGHLKSEPEARALDVLRKAGFLAPRDFARTHRPMSRSKLSRLVSEDKKLADSRHLNFVFLEDIGSPFRKKVPLQSFVTETQRQGWTSI